MQEIWKDIPGYEGIYRASDMGRIKSYDKMVNTVYGARRLFKGRVKALRPDSQGRYMLVDLSKDGLSKTRLVHRLIASTFLGDCTGFVINHLNGNTQDNRAVNLEITTMGENNKHMYRVLKRVHPSLGRVGSKCHASIPVAKIDLTTNAVLKIYESALLAEKDGFHGSAICMCCKGKQKQHLGFKWAYKSSIELRA